VQECSRDATLFKARLVPFPSDPSPCLPEVLHSAETPRLRSLAHLSPETTNLAGWDSSPTYPNSRPRSPRSVAACIVSGGLDGVRGFDEGGDCRMWVKKGKVV